MSRDTKESHRGLFQASTRSSLFWGNGSCSASGRRGRKISIGHIPSERSSGVGFLAFFGRSAGTRSRRSVVVFVPVTAKNNYIREKLNFTSTFRRTSGLRTLELKPSPWGLQSKQAISHRGFLHEGPFGVVHPKSVFLKQFWLCYFLQWHSIRNS